MSECELCGTVLLNGVCVKCLTNERDLLLKSYVPKERAGECIEALEKAGMGKPGKPNTLVSQVYEIIESRDAWKKLAEELEKNCEVWVDEEPRCIHCNGWMDNKIQHSPDCPIEQLRKLEKGEG